MMHFIRYLTKYSLYNRLTTIRITYEKDLFSTFATKENSAFDVAPNYLPKIP